MPKETLSQRMKRLEERQDKLEKSQNAITDFVINELNSMGQYRQRTDDELLSMGAKVETLTKIAETHQDIFETQEERNRAKSVNRRAKNHQTRINNEKKQQKEN
ncbi:hypothetical protein HJ177_23455 [Vibrio parahaemolyticus]|nr:hypothetical protein [Vibrio parahaemolyticus]